MIRRGWLLEQTKPNEGSVGPAVADGWAVAELGPQGVILSTDGFVIRFDPTTLNKLFDIVESGSTGEIKDHRGSVVFIEVTDAGIVLSRQNDDTFPAGVLLDEKVLKQLGIEEHEALLPSVVGDNDEPAETGGGAIINGNDLELEEGIKPAFRRAGRKIKRGYRVTSGRRKGRVVANPKTAFKPPAKARTRIKLKLAARKKKLVRWLKAKRTRAKPVSIRLRRLNKT
jgi:hypothetical protein